MVQSIRRSSKAGSLLPIVACLVAAACGRGTSYDLGASANISSVRVFYPLDAATHTTVTLSGGFTNFKEDMYWLADRLSKEGLIVFALSASDNLSVPGYEAAHKSAVALIKAQNELSTSPIYQRVGKIGLIGYSMGGGAVLNAGSDLGSQVAVVVGLAPFGPSLNLRGMTAPTLTLTGTLDLVAPAPVHSQPAYENLPSSLKRACGLVSGLEHLAWITDQAAASTLITAWIKYYAEGDQNYRATITDPPTGISYYKSNL
jgi:dienelactone hydrolase